MKKQLLDGEEIYTIDLDKGLDVKIFKWIVIGLGLAFIYEVGFLTAVYCIL